MNVNDNDLHLAFYYVEFQQTFICNREEPPVMKSPAIIIALCAAALLNPFTALAADKGNRGTEKTATGHGHESCSCR
jgi:hypothetical protein